jgi:hypothetical protein
MLASSRRLTGRTRSPSPEQQLALLLAGTAERRAAASSRIDALVASVDPASFADTLHRLALFGVVGARVAQRAGLDARWDGFCTGVQLMIKVGAHRALMQAGLTHNLLRSLEAAGVRAVSLKGPLLAQRIYGDPAVRPSGDIDLWVAPADFARALGVLAEAGYRRPAEANWYDDLPLFECSVIPEKDWMPPIDLHWRVSWYEDCYTERALQGAPLDPAERLRHLAPIDELAALLLTFARDGFQGLKLATDIAAWYDACGQQLGHQALEAVIDAHPALEESLRTALEVAEALVGVPARRLVRAREPGRRSTYARRLADWRGEGSAANQAALIAAVDWLLRPAKGGPAFARRHLLLPPAVIAEIYGLPVGARMRVAFRRAYYAAVVGIDFLRCAVRAGWDSPPALPVLPA